MASTHFAPMAFAQNAASHCVDPADMDHWVDFGALASPAQGRSSEGKRPMVSMHPGITSPTSTALPLDGEDQTPVAPSHDYGRFKQQTGLPTGALAGLRELNENQSVFGGFNSGIDEFAIGNFDGMGMLNGFGSMAGDLGLNSQALLLSGLDSHNDDFVNPTAIQMQEEEQANIRYYPGMHQQQANAMRAQQMAAQRQQVLAQQEAAEKQRQRQEKPSHAPSDPHAEETIARVVNQIRQNSMMQTSLSPEQSGLHSHMARSRKDDDDMDEDERLLNSEEGKKLSSKERRQLRNKVSARAFRSRRKEYIGQLEGELAVKANECHELKMQNRALMEENARFRSLAEKLLGHGAFRPFLEELSRDPEIAQSLTSVLGDQAALSTPQPKKDVNPYAQNSQQFNVNQNQQVGMTLVPETQLNFSQLNLGGSSWNMNVMPGATNTYQPRVFAVLELPEEPIDVAALAGKDHQQSESDSFETCKHDVPAQIESPEAPQSALTAQGKGMDAADAADDFDEQDPAFTLFATTSKPSSVPTLDDALKLLFQLPSSKPAQIELIFTEDNQEMSAGFLKTCAKLDAACSRLNALFGKLVR